MNYQFLLTDELLQTGQGNLTNIMKRNCQLHLVGECCLLRHYDKPEGQGEEVDCNQGFRILQVLNTIMLRHALLTDILQVQFTYMFQDNVGINRHMEREGLCFIGKPLFLDSEPSGNAFFNTEDPS